MQRKYQKQWFLFKNFKLTYHPAQQNTHCKNAHSDQDFFLTTQMLNPAESSKKWLNSSLSQMKIVSQSQVFSEEDSSSPAEQ